MKLYTILSTIGAVIPLASAAYSGFNVAATNPDGSCKSTAQWAAAFNRVKNAKGSFNSVRVYAASDCGTLANAVPAALTTNTKLLVGIWTEDSGHYAAEKAALQAAINAHGRSWILAISVGSEDLYRGDTTAQTLAQQIYDVRGMVRAMGVQAQVGHVDTWTAWVNGANNDVITASDFIGMDGYPYFQSASIDAAATTFWDSVTATRNAVHALDPNKKIWITETGWPVAGPDFGAAVPSIGNARNYFNKVACQAIKQGVNLWWYVESDWEAYAASTTNPTFGLYGKKGNVLYDLKGC